MVDEQSGELAEALFLPASTNTGGVKVRFEAGHLHVERREAEGREYPPRWQRSRTGPPPKRFSASGRDSSSSGRSSGSSASSARARPSF